MIQTSVLIVSLNWLYENLILPNDASNNQLNYTGEQRG